MQGDYSWEHVNPLQISEKKMSRGEHHGKMKWENWSGDRVHSYLTLWAAGFGLLISKIGGGVEASLYDFPQNINYGV